MARFKAAVPQALDKDIILGHYRGFRLERYRTTSVRCIYTMEWANLFLPRSFVWVDISNRAGLAQYIDAIVEKRAVDAGEWERNNLVAEVVASDSTYENVPIVTISPMRLMSVLRGEDPLEVHANTVFRLVNDDNGQKRYTVENFLAEVVSTVKEDEHIKATLERIETQRPIFYSTQLPHSIRSKHNMFPAPMHTGVNLASTADEAFQDPTPQAPVTEEVFLTASDHFTHTESVSLIAPQGSRPYFVRRILRKDDVLWAGSSFSIKGPWHCYYKDASRLTALGLVV